MVINRKETCKIIKNNMNNNERIIVSRYSDGEYNLMKGKGRHKSDKHGDIKHLLLRSIQYKNQLVCINELKPKNIAANDKWVRVQEFLHESGHHDSYGAANWNIQDYQTGSEILSKLFSGNILYVSGHASELKNILFKYRSDFDTYETSTKNSSNYYSKYLADIKALIKNRYDSILFSCGPIGKVIMTDIADKCDSNLVDMGAIANAIIRKEKDWDMSWTTNFNLDKLNKQLFSKLYENSN